jgi:hypothetical protein
MVVVLEYIIVTLTAVTATTLIVYKLGNRLTGVTLHIKSLILCAICALFISLILPRIVVDFAGLSGSVIFLLFFAIIFAYFVAQYDASCKPTQSTDQVIDSEAFSEVYIAVKIPFDDSIADHTLTPERVKVVTEEEVIAKTQPEFAVAAASVAVPETECTSNNNLQEKPEPVAPIILQQVNDDEERHIEEVAEEVKKIDNPNLIDCIIDPAITAEPVEFETAATVSIAADQDIVSSTFAEELPQADSSTILAAPAVSLEELMEKAYLEKEQKNFNQALIIFRQALSQYPEDDTAPFLTVEIGNILKNKGLYDEAIQVFSDGRNLSGLHNDPLLEQEFISTVAYLRIIKNTLLQHRLGFVPFNSIPEAIVEEINTEFREWRNLS